MPAFSDQPSPPPAPIISADTPARQQLQTIQAVRGVAALVVVAFHLSQFVFSNFDNKLWYGLFERGFAGVDLFFVISGFVIVYTSQAYVGRPNTLRTYLTKRVIRVYPIYWLTIAAMTALMAVTLLIKPDAGKTIADRWPGLDTILLTPHHQTLNIVSWSLSHELFFYLLFACLILSRKLWMVPAFFLLGTLVMAFTKQQYVDDASSSIWAYFWFNPLNAEFALGALVGYGFLHHTISKWEGIGAGALGLFWLYSFGDTPNEFFGERLLHYGVASMLLLIAVLAYEHLRHPKLPRWLTLTGDASYLIYLIHTPLLLPFTRLLVRLFPYYSPTGVPLTCFAFVVLVTVLGIVAHLLVEKPLMRYLSARFVPRKQEA